jgi:hypothetical protein
MAADERREIDWSSAQVHDGTLTVDLDGASSKGWRTQFERVLTMLDSPHASWGEVSIGKKNIQVTELMEGTEDEVRHFLESIVLEVNSGLEPDAAEGSDEANSPAVDPEEQMAETFRGFAHESSPQ